MTAEVKKYCDRGQYILMTMRACLSSSNCCYFDANVAVPLSCMNADHPSYGVSAARIKEGENTSIEPLSSNVSVVIQDSELQLLK